jgi:hypothetical protein
MSIYPPLHYIADALDRLRTIENVPILTFLTSTSRISLDSGDESTNSYLQDGLCSVSCSTV